MTPVLSREESRAFDRHASDACGVPSIILMENAGRSAAEALERAFSGERCCVVCGPGNNGGDGFVVARHLALRGRRVEVVLLAAPSGLRGDARVAYDALLGVGVPVAVVVSEAELGLLDAALEAPELVVDALLGTGCERAVTGLFAAAIARFGVRPVVALDVPSGLDANTGRPLGVAVRARRTVAFGHLKLGLCTPLGLEHAGVIEVASLGVPPLLAVATGVSAWQLDAADVLGNLPARPATLHKRSAGKVLAVAGSAGKHGAAELLARGALRAGAGLVTLAGSAATAERLGVGLPEAMTASLDAADRPGSLRALFDAADAVVIGPGLGLDGDARALTEEVLAGYAGSAVLDADALTHYSGRAQALRGARGALILTPHAGELARLLDVTADEIERDRFGAVKRAAEASGAVVVLKGSYSLIAAPGEPTLVSAEGAGVTALATAGSGDVLAGVIGALAAAGVPPRWAAACGVALHGRAGRLWQAQHGDRGLLASELAELLPEARASLVVEAKRDARG